MRSFPWTKFQDFYLRLGFLKVLACALDPGRRSVSNQSLERRLAVPLFEPATKYEHLWCGVRHAFSKDEREDAKNPITVTEALLIKDNLPSILFAITRKTTYKILDWGHDVDFVGRGNQMTERALVLKTLLPAAKTDQFMAGDASAWNPFYLTIPERLFFLYHIGELDQMMIDLISALANEGDGRILESADAARLTCEAFFGVLGEVEARLVLRDTPRFRTAQELACAIAEELELAQFAAICGSRGRRLARIGRVGAKRSGLTRPGEKARKTTKNADHQTIPRFEQLTDLGFLRKHEPDITGQNTDLSYRKRWRYIPTDMCFRWRDAIAANAPTSQFFTTRFAKTAVSALDLGRPVEDASDETVARYFWRAYESVKRPVGHTPFDSVALLGMIYAATDGVAIEIERFHSLLLTIKRQDLLPQHAFFASGNEIEKMFLLLKPGFLDAFGTTFLRRGERTP